MVHVQDPSRLTLDELVVVSPGEDAAVRNAALSTVWQPTPEDIQAWDKVGLR